MEEGQSIITLNYHDNEYIIAHKFVKQTLQKELDAHIAELQHKIELVDRNIQHMVHERYQVNVHDYKYNPEQGTLTKKQEESTNEREETELIEEAESTEDEVASSPFLGRENIPEAEQTTQEMPVAFLQDETQGGE